MSEEINAVIDKLCDKLGTSASLLIPELAKLKTFEYSAMLVFFLIIMVIGLYFLPKAWRYDHEEEEYYKHSFGLDDRFSSLFPSGIILIGIFGVISNAIELIGWLMTPTIKAVFILLKMYQPIQ